MLAIIPAKAKSERLPGKNFELKLAGKSLVEWALEAASACPYTTNIVLLTDYKDKELNYLKSKYKFDLVEQDEYGISRNKGTEYILKAAYHKNLHEYEEKFYILLQPTQPFRNHVEFNHFCKQLILQEKPLKAGKGYYYGDFLSNIPKYCVEKRNYLGDMYYDSNKGYIDSFEDSGTIVEHVIDIDTEEDFKIAQQIYNIQFYGNKEGKFGYDLVGEEAK